MAFTETRRRREYSKFTGSAPRIRPAAWIWSGLILLLIACGGERSESGDHSYTGTELRLDFSNAGPFMNGDWIEVDGVRFTHYLDLDLVIEERPHGLFASESGPDENRLAPVDAHSIMLNLVHQFEYVQGRYPEEEGGGSGVRALHDVEMYGGSILRLVNEDEEPFTIRTSPGYRLPIEVVRP